MDQAAGHVGVGFVGHFDCGIAFYMSLKSTNQRNDRNNECANGNYVICKPLAGDKPAFVFCLCSAFLLGIDCV